MSSGDDDFGSVVMQVVGGLLMVFGNVYFAALGFALELAAADRQRSYMNRKADEAFAASLRDREYVVRGSDVAGSIAYGRVGKVGGVLVYAESTGPLKEELQIVVAFAPVHEIDAIEELYIGDQKVGTLDGDGWVRSGHFAVTKREQIADTFASTYPTTTVTLTHDPVNPAEVQAFTNTVPTTDNPGGQSIPIQSINGRTVVLDTSGAGGAPIVINYQSDVGYSFLRVRTYLGTPTDLADQVLIDASNGAWTSAHRGRGRPHVCLTAIFDEDVWAGIDPHQVSAVMRGKKIYDPRTGVTAWSRNAAMVQLDYLTDVLGFECDYGTEINSADAIAEANTSDEWITVDTSTLGSESAKWKAALDAALPFGTWELVSGTTYRQRRYCADGLLSTEADRIQNMQALLTASSGRTSFSQGRCRILAARWRPPTGAVVTDADLTDREKVETQAAVAYRDLFNGVRGTFFSPVANWQRTDFPVVQNPTYIAEDGQELDVDLDLPFTIDAIAAQRLARLALEDSRQGMVQSASFTMALYTRTPGDVISRQSDRYGWSVGSPKPFRIIDRKFSLENGVKLVLKEDAVGIYDWSPLYAVATDIAPNTELPSPRTVAALAGVNAEGVGQFRIGADGTLFAQILVTWTAPLDINVLDGGSIEIQYRNGGETDWTSISVDGRQESARIEGVVDGQYYVVRVRARNGLGVRGPWENLIPIEVQTNALVTVSPSSLTLSTVGAGTRRFTIVMPAAVATLDSFEIRVQVGATISWGSADVLALVPAAIGAGLTWSFETEAPTVAGTYSFEVRAFDRMGHYSPAGAKAQNVALAAPGTPTVGLGYANLLANSGPDIHIANVPGWFLFNNSTGLNLSIALQSGGWNPNAFGAIEVHFGDGSYQPGDGFFMVDVGNTGTGGAVFDSLYLPVVAGQRYEFSGYSEPHRCKTQIGASFYDVNKTYITTVWSDPLITAGGLQFAPLSQWRRTGAFVAAPNTAAYVIFHWRVYGAGAVDPYFFASACYLAPAHAGQTELSPWTPGGVIDGREIVAKIPPNALAQIFTAQTAADLATPCTRNVFIGGSHTYDYGDQTCSISISGIKAGNSLTIDSSVEGYNNNGALLYHFPGVITDLLVAGSGKVQFHRDSIDKTGNLHIAEFNDVDPAGTRALSYVAQRWTWTAPSDCDVIVYLLVGMVVGSNGNEMGRGSLRVEWKKS